MLRGFRYLLLAGGASLAGFAGHSWLTNASLLRMSHTIGVEARLVVTGAMTTAVENILLGLLLCIIATIDPLWRLLHTKWEA